MEQENRGMSFLLDFPRLKCYCDLQYLSNRQVKGWVECYIFAVTLIESRSLLFTIHTIDGAVYSRIPLEALKTKKNKGKLHIDRWGAISSNGTVIQHQYLKDYRCVTIAGEWTGRYWATIDYLDGGFAQDPEQHKTSHILLMDTGDIIVCANNEVLFTDEHFVIKQSKNLKNYRRNTQYYL